MAMKREKQRIFGLLVILVIASTLTGTIASLIFYSTALKQKSDFLQTEVLNLSRLIEAVARFDRNTFKEVSKSTAATLSQVEAAFRDQKGVGESGEIMLGRMVNKKIQIFLRFRDDQINQNLLLPSGTDRSEAMALALSGKTGVGQFVDLRGERVLAAYTYVSYLGIGLEIKVTMSEIIRPYLYSGVIIAAASAVVILVCAFFFIRITRPVLQEIRRLTHRMIEIKDEEQDNISKELHDTLGTSLVWLKFQMQHLARDLPGSKEQVESLLKHFDDTIEMTRNLSYSLSPVAIEKLSLGVMLERLVERARYFSSAKIDLVHKNLDIDLPVGKRFHMFRIVQEALNNALKHSGAARVSIECSCDAGHVHVKITDDGVGIRTNVGSRGLGLSLMKERAKLLSGELSIVTRKNRGTEVMLDFPVG